MPTEKNHDPVSVLPDPVYRLMMDTPQQQPPKLGTGQNLSGTRAGTIDRGAKTFFRKKYTFSANVPSIMVF